MADPQAVDPIVYPTVLIGGVSVEVKFRIGDLIRLKKSGVEVGDTTALKGADGFERMIKLLHAGIAHTNQTKTIEELSDMVTLAEFPLYTEAVNEAFEQARIQQEKVNARHPKQETPETPAPVQEIPSSIG